MPPTGSSSSGSGSTSASTSGASKRHFPLDIARHLFSRHAPADPGSPADPSQEQADATAQLARQAADQQTLQQLQTAYVDVFKVPIDGAMFPYEGVCLRCGWHTLELTQDAATKMVQAHVNIHWRDAVVGIQLQGGSGPLGMEGAEADLRYKAMLAQEKGAQQGGAAALKPIQAEQKQREQQLSQVQAQFSGGSGSSSSGSKSPSGGD